MYLFYLIIIYILFSGYLYEILTKTNTSKKILLFSTFGLFFILSGFRASNIGNDTVSYLNVFTNLLEPGGFERAMWRYETGYLLLNKVSALISTNPQIILIVSSGIVMLFFAKFIYRYSEIPWLSVFLFVTLGFFPATMNIIRMSLAFSIILWAFKFLNEKKLLPFIFVVILASTFHRTSIVFLSAWLFRDTKINTKLTLSVLSSGLFLFLIWPLLLSLIINIFPLFSYYLEGQYMKGGIRLASILNLLVSFVILLIGLLYKDRIKDSRQNQLMLLLILIGTSISIVALRFNLLERVATVFIMFSIAFLPNLIKSLSNKKNIIILYSAVIVFFFIFRTIIFIYRPNWNTIFPYSFFWQ